jgi:two-component system response regulator AgrA
MNGLILAQEIRKHDPRGFIIFITTHSEMSYLTFLYKCEALDFIIKDDFEEYKRRIHSCLMNVSEKTNLQQNGDVKKYVLKTKERQLNIDYDEIIYFETSDNIHKVKLHTTNTIIEYSEQLKNILPTLDERFIRCHRSFIVNRNHISQIDFKNKTILMSNSDTCLISARMMKTVREVYL